MKYIVAIFALSVAVASAFDREKAKEAIHEWRIESQNMHIDKLIKEVEELEEEYSHLSPIPEKSRVKEVKARIRNLEDEEDKHKDIKHLSGYPFGRQACDKNHESCGGPVPECISPLLVCDGYKDCKNGRDESDEVCSDATYRVGTTISGITSWTDCVNHRPHMTVITITANFKPQAYPSQVYVRAVISFEVDEHSHLVKSFPAKGYWSPGKRLLALVPDETFDHSEWAGHGVVCKFNLGTNDKADCKIGAIASKHVCATFRGTRH